jgi:hypothetical protein
VSKNGSSVNLRPSNVGYRPEQDPPRGQDPIPRHLDVFNLLNGSTVLQRNQAIGPTFLQPTQILELAF